jgi:GGDEF domain-containing protein
MESSETATLTQLTNQRFRSFSEAVESVLATLEETIPGTVMLGQLDPAEELCRVVDLRGTSISLERGMTLPLAAAAADENGGSGSDGLPDVPVEGRLDREFLGSLSVEACLAIPLEMTDGSIVGTLCALDTAADSYSHDHLAILAVAARLLGYEWDSVRRRVELQRLNERLREVDGSDADTGLLNRESFLDCLDREWRLTERGSVESVLMVCQVRVEAPAGGLGETMATLALKDAAEVLGATTRSTDHAGRTGTMDLAAILVGCHGSEGARAFVRRFGAALERVTEGRAMPISIFWGTQALADSPSAAEALEQAERIAQDEEAARVGKGSALKDGADA